MVRINTTTSNGNQIVQTESLECTKKPAAPSGSSTKVRSTSVENHLSEKKWFTHKQNSTAIMDRTVEKVDTLSPSFSSQPIEAFTGEYMNASGAMLISQHFTEKYQDKSHGYSVTSPTWQVACNPMDIDVLCDLNKEEPTFCMQVLTLKKHWVPVMIKNNKAFIFDSVSGESAHDCMAEVMMPLKNRDFEIYVSKDQRQFDFSSCGTDSCTVINKCCQMPDHFISWVDDKHDEVFDHRSFKLTIKEKLISDEFRLYFSEDEDLDVAYMDFPTPPEIQKYTQSLGKARRYAYKDKAMTPGRRQNTGETLIDYVQKHTKEVDGKKQAMAMTERYEKYKTIASNMLIENQSNMNGIVLDKTGLGKLLELYPEEVRDHPQTVSLVQRFVSDRLHHRVNINDLESTPFPASLNSIKRELDRISAEQSI